MNGHNHFVLEMMDIFLRAGGLTSVYIPFNSTDEDLYYLLNSVNGVFFTGGSLNLSDPVTNQLHPYTVTAQKILNYALEHNDNGDYFPIMGVC